MMDQKNLIKSLRFCGKSHRISLKAPKQSNIFFIFRLLFKSTSNVIMDVINEPSLLFELLYKWTLRWQGLKIQIGRFETSLAFILCDFAPHECFWA
jgi:hypothetical protein